MGDNYEWELSKENIQPLKHGRNISSLVTALTVHEDHHKQQRNEQRKQMELAIMSYEGSDPLDLWSKYILWVEENYPQGGKEGDLLTILEKCLEKLRDCTQYKSDNRLLEVYLRYLDLTENNSEWFQQLYGAGYFHKLSNFYIHWADTHEMNSNFKEGTKVYQLGLQNKAEPITKLEEAFKHYQARVANTVFKNMNSVEVEGPARNAFGELDTERRAPALRTGSQVRRAPFQNRVLPGPKSTTNKPLFIHQDDENSVPHAPVVSAKAAIPIHSIMKAENTVKATKWNESSGVVHEVVHQTPQATFQVHVDDSLPQSHKKVTDGFNSALKDKTAAVKLNPQTLFERENPKMKMMCDLNKILVANREFSFEEIRRQIYEKRHTPRKVEVKTPVKIEGKIEVKTPLSARKETQRELPAPLKSNEKWHCAIDSLFQDGRELTFEHLRAKLYESRLKKDCPVIKEAEKQLLKLRVSEKVERKDACVQTDLFGLEYDVVLVPRKVPERSKTPSPVRSTPEPLGGSGSNSPTVNTKNALSSVKSWFNSSVLVPESRPEPKPVKKSLFTVFKDPTLVEEPQEKKPFAVFSDSVDEVDEKKENFKKPFPVFTDEAPKFVVFDENADKENQKKVRRPLAAIEKEEEDESKENVPPKGFIQETVKRSLSGVLVPSVDVPCDPSGLIAEQVDEVASVLDVPSAARRLVLESRDEPVQSVVPPRALIYDEEDQTRCYFAPMAQVEDFTVPSALAFANNLHIQSTPLTRSQLPVLEDATFNLPAKKAIQMGEKPVPRGLSPIDEGSREYYSSSASSAGISSQHSRLSVGRSLHDAGRIYPAHFNPFDNEHRLGQLTQLQMPVEKRGGFTAMTGRLPWLRTHSNVQLGRDCYTVKQVIGQGAYAKIYDAFTEQKEHVVLKVQESDGVWEFYISTELQRRMDGAPTANSVMKVERGYFYESGSILINQHLSHGTLLDLVNHYRLRNSLMPEPLVYHFTLQLLSLVRDMHECGILHADIKADNIMLQAPIKTLVLQAEEWSAENLLKEDCPTLKLIDLGRCLDLALYPDKTSFMYVFQDDKCPEMRDGKSWSYQLDYYGIASTIFTLLMGVHCKVVNVDSQWRVPNLKRGHNSIWRDLTTALLNTPSNTQLDLLNLRQILAEQMIASVKLRDYNDRVRELERYLNHKQ